MKWHHHCRSPYPDYNSSLSPWMNASGFHPRFSKLVKLPSLPGTLPGLKTPFTSRKAKKIDGGGGIKTERTQRKIHNPPRCRKWHSKLNIMLLVTASVADRLVGCRLERDCLPVCCRSRPHALLTSAMEQQTIQQPCSPTGSQTRQPITHNK